MKKLVALLGLLTMTLAAPAMAQFAKPEDAVKYRKAVMTLQARHVGLIAPYARGDRPFDAASVAANAAILETVTKLAWVAYMPGSDLPGSRAKPEAWTEPAKFKDLSDKLVAEIAKLSVAAKAGDQASVRSAFGSVNQACKACHDVFWK